MALKVEIRKVAGVPRLWVNGKPMAGLTYHNRQTDFLAYMKQFADSGTELFFSYYVRDWTENWEEHFRTVARRLDGILALNPRIYAILGLHLSAHQQWAEAHPDELCRRDGSPCMAPVRIANTERFDFSRGCTTAAYSLASDKFDAVAQEHVNRTLDFLETYPARDRIIGLFLGAARTHEWNPFSPDPGPSALRAYRAYLMDKYGSETELRKCWGDKGASFASLSPPTAAELENAPVGCYFVPKDGGQRVIDWRLALAEAKSRRMLNAAKAVKDRRKDLLVGTFHGNFYGDPGVTQRILETPYLDYLVSPPQYHARCPGQHMPLNQMVDSLHCYGKLFFSEDDLFPYDHPYEHLAKAAKLKLPFQGDAGSLSDTLAVYEKDLGLTIAKGTMSWYYHFQEKFFKREKRYFEMNRRMLGISRLNIRQKCHSNAEMLVVCDERGCAYLRRGSRVTQKQVDRELTFELGYLGAPYDVMFMDALVHPDLDLSKYKLVFFLNSHMATRKQRQIVQRLKSDGRTIIFGHGAGFLADDGASVENMKALTGFDFEQLDVEYAATITLVDTPNPINRHLPPGYTFGQSYRAKRMRGDAKGQPLLPPPANASPIFAVADRQAMDVGFYNLEMPAGYRSAAQTRGAMPYRLPGFADWPRYFVGMALKENRDWNALYVGAMTIPPALLRAICKYAGVHLYVESDDILYCNNKFLVLHTNDLSGKRELKFRKRTNVYDLKRNRRIAARVKSLTLDCPGRRTWLLWLDNKPPTLG